jgi:hypothetical protein
MGPTYKCPDCDEADCICVDAPPDGSKKPMIVPDRWYDAETTKPLLKKRVEVFSEEYAKSGSFSPFQFAKWMGESSGGWVIDGGKQNYVNVSHWRKPKKPF